MGINEQLEAIVNADPKFSGRLEFVWLPSGKLCMMSDMYREKKSRAGTPGPHIGVAPHGDLIGNAGRGDWGQFDIIPCAPHNATALLAHSNPSSPAMQLLVNFAKHRELFGAPGATYVIEQTPTKIVRATLTSDIRLPKMKVERWSVVGCAPPSPLQIQDVRSSSLKIYDGETLVSGGDMISDTNGHFLFRALARGKGPSTHAIRVKLETEAQLYAIKLRKAEPGDFIPAVIPISAETRAYHLRATSLMDFNSPNFAAWVTSNQLHPIAMADGSVEALLPFCYRVFLFMKIYFSYVRAKDVKGRKASETIGVRYTDCGGFCVLYSAIMRMHGIPSRLLFGRWSMTAAEGEQNPHVKGEFYVDQVGWVPFDPASAITADQTSPFTRFFGNDNGNLVCMHLDHNLTGVDTAIAGTKQIEFLQGITFWVTGEVGGDFSELPLDCNV
eukprot:gene14978-17712_t